MPAGTGQRASFEHRVWRLIPSAGHFIPCPHVAVVMESFELTASRQRSWWEDLQSALLLAFALVHPQLLPVFLSVLSCSPWFLASSGRQVCRRSTFMREPVDSCALQLRLGQSCALKEELSLAPSATDSAQPFPLLIGLFFFLRGFLSVPATLQQPGSSTQAEPCFRKELCNFCSCEIFSMLSECSGRKVL